jgi:hypothetical protein
LAKRGRPRKFDRPAVSVSVTLPLDAVAALRRVHLDPGWAIVKLLQKPSPPARVGARVEPAARLIQAKGRHRLIAVDPASLAGVPGLVPIPLGDGRAIISLGPSANIDTLELTLADRGATLPADSPDRTRVLSLRDQIRRWRVDDGVVFRSRTILVAEQRRERTPAARRRRTGSGK